jgi:hypothetical protein
MRSLLRLVSLGWLLGLNFVAVDAFAVPVKSLDFSIHEEYVSTRALGMGNAFTAVADDHSAIFYNPSALAFRSDGQLRMFLRAGADAESFKLFNEIKDVDKETKDLPDNQKTQPYVDLIQKHYGDHFNFRIPTIGAAWVRPGWGIAFIPADLSLDVDVHRQIGPMLNVNLYLDSTIAFAYARKTKWFKGHETAWGATIKGVHRVYVGQSLSAGALADGTSVFETKDANEGFTGDIDLSFTWKPPAVRSFFRYLKPTFAIVGRNLIDYGFTTNFHFIDKNSGEPPKLGRRFDFGSKWDLPKFWVFDPHLAIDIRNVGHDNWTWKKGSHAGMEFYWKMFNWWKGHWSGGLNEGYWTAGFGARLAWFQIDLCSFGEEVGTASSPLEDRRYMLELALDF